MSGKIQFTLEAVTKGTKDIVSTTTATEKLTAALEAQRGEVKSLNQQLGQIKGFENAEKRTAKLAEQMTTAKTKVITLEQALDEQQVSTRGLRVEYTKTEQEIRSLNQQMKTASKEGAVGLKQQLSVAESKLEGLNNEMHVGKQRTNELKTAYRKAAKNVDTLSDKQSKQKARLASLGGALKRAGVSTDKLGDEQKRLKSLTEQATGALEKQNKRLKEMQGIQARIDSRKAKLGELGGQATSLAMAAAPLGASVWTAIKNESSFANVKKVVDMSPEQAAAMRSWSLKTSTETPMNANEINAMLAAGGQSGIKDTNELKQFVLDSAKMGVAFDMEAGKAGETLAVFKAAMGLDQKGAVGLAGLANHLSNNSNAKAADIAGVMAREGATAKKSGFSVNDAAALSAAMLSTGMQQDRAATALKNISGRLTLGDAASGNQKKALASIGFDSTALAGTMQSDASGTLLNILAAINDAPLEKQSALISQIFGEEAKGAVAALAGNTKNYTQALKLSREGQDVHVQSLQDEYNARINTSENGIQQFINKLNRLSVIVGGALLPALNWVMEPLGNVVDMIANFAEANQGLTAAVGLGIAGFIGLKGILLAGKAASLIFGNTLDKSKLFRKGLNRETQQGGRIAAMAAKQWRSLNTAVASSRGPGQGKRRGTQGVGGEYRSRTRSRSRSPRRRRGLGGMLSNAMSSLAVSPKGLGLAAAGGGLAMIPVAAMAQDAIDIGGSLAEKAGKFGLAKVLKPLGLAINAVQATKGIVNDDMEQAGNAIGDIGGSLAGAAAGAAIGSVVPVIGTAIGGLVGAIAGGIGGEMMGGWFGRQLDSPDETAKKVNDVQMTEAEARQRGNVHFAPVIHVNGVALQDPSAVANAAVEKMNQQYSYLMGGNTMTKQFSYAAIDQG
ncbi:phage tail tape measure protein [Photobacterium frigidiphilum]|uniref:phage tail tape measure protein n=1 Tax=Photobacterium frigidiphilum TaxID=264736 RepID=UPI003D0E843E